MSNDLLKTLETGTTAKTRIGNKVKVQYVKGTITMSAAALQMASSAALPGEEIEFGNASPATQSNVKYIRTTIRIAIVKDTQVNSTDTTVEWPMVFDGTGGKGYGVHSELNLDNMGRFVVLDDKVFEVDGDDPMKSYRFNIPGSKVGSVRYNGPTTNALTDKGIYVVWSAFVLGESNNTALRPPGIVLNSRFCFTDD